MNKSNITPIFIVGAARNGTTYLENAIASFPQVAGVEHWLHYGSHESNICRNKKFWGDISNIDVYVDFLYLYSSYDYFKLCKGNIDYHLENRQENYYNFFFDLMDNYCLQENKRFWITKLDPQFFLLNQERELFFSILKNRYSDIKIIRIQREFSASYTSYLNMEGKNHKLRQNPMNLWPSLFLQASRYVLTYSRNTDLDEHKVLDIQFEDYIKDKITYLSKIYNYLGIENNELESIDFNRFQINTSFVKQKRNKLTSEFLRRIVKVEAFLKKHPAIASIVWKAYEQTRHKNVPDFRRLTKYKYYRAELLNELQANKSYGLIKEINNE